MKSILIPTLRYHDPAKAITFLSEAFGFEEKAAFKNDEGIVIHAELAIGDGILMIGWTGYDSPFGQFLIHPDETKGRNTMTGFIVVEDPDAHYAQAQAAGAEILLPLVEQSYGGKDYSCRDIEGYVWSFGSYDPRKN
ncbi:MAG: glyoxalase [Saprospiraceae bacterium]|nr:glyoxalase [Saprospiraceae bacterium]